MRFVTKTLQNDKNVKATLMNIKNVQSLYTI